MKPRLKRKPPARTRPSRPPQSKAPRQSTWRHRLFPSCDGEPWGKADASSQEGKVKLAFLEAYFRINLAYARLLAARFRRTPGSAPRPSERRILLQIEKALVARDRLEDNHAARGLIATAVNLDGFTIDVRFTDAGTAQARRDAIITSSAAVRITIPLPLEVRAKLCKN
jgi:hypothetical protein